MRQANFKTAWLIVFCCIIVPWVVWDTLRTVDKIENLEETSSSPDGRVATCVAKTEELISIPEVREKVCQCVVDKAEAEGALERFGSYDEGKLTRSLTAA